MRTGRQRRALARHADDPSPRPWTPRMRASSPEAAALRRRLRRLAARAARVPMRSRSKGARSYPTRARSARRASRFDEGGAMARTNVRRHRSTAPNLSPTRTGAERRGEGRARLFPASKPLDRCQTCCPGCAPSAALRCCPTGRDAGGSARPRSRSPKVALDPSRARVSRPQVPRGQVIRSWVFSSGSSGLGT